MFDLGLTKLAVIGIIALIVIGPKHLPRIARTVGSLLGRAQRTFNEVKAEVAREIETPLNEINEITIDPQTAIGSGSVNTNNISDINNTEQSTVRKNHSQTKRLTKRAVLLSSQYKRPARRRHLQSGAARVLQLRLQHTSSGMRQSARFF